jgi:restriction system protein
MGATRYWRDIHHTGLGLYKRVSAATPEMVEWTARSTLAQWDERWKRKQESAQKRATRERTRASTAAERERTRASKAAERAYKESRQHEAQEATAAAEQELAGLERVLTDALRVSSKVDFESLKKREAFPEPEPIQTSYAASPPEPSATYRQYVPSPVSLFAAAIELVSGKARQERLTRQAAEALALRAEDDARNASADAEWCRAVQEVEAENARQKAGFDAAWRGWQRRKSDFEQRQSDFNRDIDAFQVSYGAGEAIAVEQYCDMVLFRSIYPDYFPKTFETQYAAESRQLVVEYVLPEPARLPKTKSVKYVASNDELLESPISEAAAKKLYDSVVYQVILRTIHELLEGDSANALDAVALNAIVETIDRATGQAVRPCIASIHVTKAEFQTLNLAAIDPKACFRKLKGIGSSELVALAPVAPIVQMSRNDARFIDGREVLSGVSEGTNLALMEWEEFEHLVRQLLEREFAAGSAEVRVTQASRDGGVDAVVFNPDPIHGGKFVVQAKRYTNTVPVAAVRELWGTMSHERASKGILVTTATFGPDAYEFAKDKPISLIDGSNLLFLLEKHGTRAFIDIKKARMTA